MNDHQLLIREKKAQIVFDTACPDLYFSEVNAKQLLQNLMVNGLTYNEAPQAKIHLGCHSKEGYWPFYVKDNGIGINEEYQQKVFTLFQRLHTVTEYPGTGIGLAICKKIVERNGGDIWFTSNEAGGTTFHFTLAHQKVQLPRLADARNNDREESSTSSTRV